MKNQFLFAISTLAISLLMGAVHARDIDPSEYSTGLRWFITDVVYVVEAGDRDKKFIKCAPHVQVKVHGDKYSEVLFNTKLKEFLDITGVSTEKPADEKAVTCDLQVYFGTTDEIKEKAAEIVKDIGFKDGATYWKWWDRSYNMNKAFIFVSTEEFKGAAMEDRLVELLLGVFGLPSQSKRADNSCLSQEEGIRPSLQPLDVAVLKFLYESVPAGVRPAELRALVREKWPKP